MTRRVYIRAISVPGDPSGCGEIALAQNERIVSAEFTRYGQHYSSMYVRGTWIVTIEVTVSA